MKKKICVVASAPGGIISFWKTNIERLSEQFDVYVVANYQEETVFSNLKIKGKKSVNILRRPSLWSMVKAAYTLRKYFKQEQFDGFISMSLNASLVSAIAGWMARIPFRARIFTGQIWANKTGFSRTFYKMLDKITICLNNHFLVDGESQQEYLIENGILKEGQSIVLANGSICGVDVDLFNPSEEKREEERKRLGFDDSDVVFTFMGRLNRDKGTYELLEAFNRLAATHENSKLLLIGNSEGITEDTFKSYDNISIDRNLLLYGYTKQPYYALQAGDVFCLPSYREGFGMSVIEAAALGLPVIASDAYGLRDSFVDGKTGLKCKVKDVDTLFVAMQKLYINSDLRKEYGKYGRERVVEMFSMELVSNAWLNYLLQNIK